MKAVAIEIRDKVSSGSYLWQTLQAYPNIFPKLFVALIRAGEASGSMDQMLKRLCRYLEDADRLRKMLKSASMYPIIVVSIGIGVISLMLIFVIPKFEELLKGSGQALPAPTQFIIDLSHFLVANIVYIIVGGVALYYMVSRYFKSEEGRAFRDRALFRAPLFGNIMQKGGVARFSRTMQTLLVSGVNLIDAIDICKSTIDNAVLEAAVGTIRSEIESGKTLGAVVGRLTVFPKMATQMISVGEQTGNLDQMLDKVADFYEAEVETLVAGITKLIEPFVLVFLGGTVGGLMIAMYLPIFKLAGGAE
jgi:type IV pilus assembly protein PilC